MDDSGKAVQKCSAKKYDYQGRFQHHYPSATNPLFGWLPASLINKTAHLNMGNKSLLFFILCNAIGTLLTMSTYMVFGKKLPNYFKLIVSTMNKVTGFVFVSLALFHLVSFNYFQ